MLSDATISRVLWKYWDKILSWLSAGDLSDVLEVAGESISIKSKLGSVLTLSTGLSS